MSEALNKDIQKPIIIKDNKWRNELRANGITHNMSILQWYMDAEVAVPLLKQYASLLPG